MIVVVIPLSLNGVPPTDHLSLYCTSPSYHLQQQVRYSYGSFTLPDTETENIKCMFRTKWTYALVSVSEQYEHPIQFHTRGFYQFLSRSRSLPVWTDHYWKWCIYSTLFTINWATVNDAEACSSFPFIVILCNRHYLLNFRIIRILQLRRILSTTVDYREWCPCKLQQICFQSAMY